MDNIQVKLDEEAIEFHNCLCKMSRVELIDIIDNYWLALRKKAEVQMANKVDNIQENEGRVRMDEVNILKILAKIKSQHYKE
jgi:hypothetical protein